MTRSLLLSAALALSLTGAAQAQTPDTTPPAAAQPPAGQAQPPKTAPAPRVQRTESSGGGRAINVAVSVTDGVGLGIQGVHVIVNGPITRDAQTVADGTVRVLGLKQGAYRFRFEHERFVTLERDVVIKGGQPTDVDVTLTRAPEKAKAEAPPPPAPSAPARASAPLPGASFDVASYLEKDYLKSGANRVKSIACSASDAVSVVQTISSYASAAGARQLVAVAIAGQGHVSVAGRSSPIDSKAGTTVVVPANAAFEATREGKGTLVFVLIGIGEGCAGQ